MPRGARDLLLILGALGLCPVAAALVGPDPGGAVERARAIAGAEDALGLHVEPAIHAWGLERPALMTAAGLFYIFAHIGVLGWALVWTWCLRRDAFARVRDLFLATQTLLFAAYVLVPTAPPRLVPGSGARDTLAGLWGHEAAGSAHLIQSAYAAMPSGHVAFALVAGWVFARLGDQPWLRAFGWAYPPLVVAVTVVTGHHLWLDAIGALALVGVAGALSAWRRPVTRAGSALASPSSWRCWPPAAAMRPSPPQDRC